MKPVRSAPRAILLSLISALLIVGSAGFVAAVAAYVMLPPPSEPDPFILVIVAALTLGPSIMLLLATTRARAVSLSWDLGNTGRKVLVTVSILMAGILAVAGMYPVLRLVKMFVAH